MSVKTTRIMFMEHKADGAEGAAHIGRVTFSKTGLSVTVGGTVLTPNQSFTSNYVDPDTGEEYWISAPKRHGGDRIYGKGVVEIDDDVRVDYWTTIREQPERQHETRYWDG